MKPVNIQNSRTAIMTLLIASLLMISVKMKAQSENGELNPENLKKLSIEELMNLEVMSVSKRAEKLAEAASAIQVITHEDLVRYGATTIPEALRLASNLHVAQKNSHDWAISARGFNTDLANKLLVLIDGRTVYTPLFSSVFWDRQDYLLEDIERIEVISGPGSTLWGSNAVNGVINIITKKSSDTQGLYAEAGGGTQLKQFGGIRYGGTISSKTFFRIYGKYFDRDDAVFPNGDDASDSWRMGQTGFRMESKLSGKNAFNVQGDFYLSRPRLSTGGTSKVGGGNILGRWARTISETSSATLQVYYDRTHLSQPIPESKTSDNTVTISPAGTFSDDLDTYDLDFQHSVQLAGRHHAVWGIGYRYTHDVVKNAPGLAFSPEEFNFNLFSGFLQDEISLTDNLFFTIGTKIEHNDYTKFEFEPSTRLQWNVDSKNTIWSAVSRAVRIPSRIDRHIRLPTPGFSPLIENLLIGGENFDSETVISYELGYRAQATNKLSTSLAFYYNVYDRIRSTSVSPPPAFFGLPFFYDNNLEGEIYGAEFNFTYQASEWMRLRGGYSMLREDIRVKSGQTDFNNALNETADPEHQFSLQSFVDLSKKFELNAVVRWVDSFTYNISGKSGTVSDYAELDARLVWIPTDRIEISIVGQNLLQERHAEYVISSPNPRAEIERSIYGKIACRF